MRRRSVVVAALAVIVVVLVVIGVVRFRSRPAPAPPSTAGTAADASGTLKFLMEQQWAIRMKLAQAESAVVARQIVTPGRLIPAHGRQASVAPPVAGLITSGALPRVGQAVARGDTVAILRHVPSSAEAAQIETGRIEELRLAADRRRAVQAIAEAEIHVAHARRELDRTRRLYEAKAVAQRQLEAVETELKTAEAVLATAVAQRDALQEPAGASRPAGGTPSTTYSVTAPIAGTVTRVAKSAGEQVAAGEAILEIVALDVLWAEVPVFEADLPRLAQPERAAFTAASLPGTELSGRLVNRGAVVDPRTRAATLLFEVANPDRRLPVGLALEARLDAGERVQAVMVPREAVLEAEGKHFAYVLRSGEEFERRDVVVGDQHGAKIAVMGGLKPGERVVTQGSWQLRQHELRPASPRVHTHE
jgi:membrane fusion protein, heavy metal efflux system